MTCERCGEEVCCCAEMFNLEVADLYYDYYRMIEVLEEVNEDKEALAYEVEKLWELNSRGSKC